MFCFFFFSSRRRHTRCSRDWSSDVCSSDLVGVAEHLLHHADVERMPAGKIQPAVDVVDRRPQRLGELHRSEEHTSELQSRLHLVCRLLLEKKKNTKNTASDKYRSTPHLTVR